MARTLSSPVKRIGPILLVDDYEDARASLREALENAGYRVSEAADGQQALHRLVNGLDERPALIVLDLQMPVMDGWRLLDLMSRYVGLSSIPVIIVTAHEPRLEQQRHPSIVAWFRSPYASENLIEMIDSCLTDARTPSKPASETNGRG